MTWDLSKLYASFDDPAFLSQTARMRGDGFSPVTMPWQPGAIRSSSSMDCTTRMSQCVFRFA